MDKDLSIPLHLSHDRFEAAVSRCVTLIDRLPEKIEAGARRLDLGSLGVIVQDGAAVKGALRFRLDPSERLLNIVAALETLDREFSGAE